MRSWSSRSDAKRSSAVGQRRSSAPSRWASSTAGIDDGGVGESGEGRSQRRRPVLVQEHAQHRGGRALAGDGRAQATLLDERARARGGPAFEPSQRGRRRAAGHEQLLPGVRGDGRGSASSRDSTRARSSAPRPPAHRPPSSTRSSGPSMSTPSRQRRRRSVTGRRRSPRASGGGRCPWRGPGRRRGRVAARAMATASAEKRSLASAAGRVARRRPRPGHDGRRPSPAAIAPEPRTTRPPSPTSAARSRSRRPNGVSSGGPDTTRAAEAPAARNPARWRSARLGTGSGHGRPERTRGRSRAPGAG